jgi:hypothetical protein
MVFVGQEFIISGKICVDDVTALQEPIIAVMEVEELRYAMNGMIL